MLFSFKLELKVGFIMAQIETYDSKESAGDILAVKIKELNLEKPYVLAVLRGGIQVAEGIADKLKVPINPLAVKKLPSPGNPEYGFGAVTEDGTKVLNERAVSYIGIGEDDIEGIAGQVVQEIQRRKEVYGGLDDEKIGESDVIIVDDGIATGYSLIAGINTVKKRNPKSVTVAVPVSSQNAYFKIKGLVDHIVCPLASDESFFAVAAHYKTWVDLTEEQIKSIIENYRKKYTK